MTPTQLADAAQKVSVTVTDPKSMISSLWISVETADMVVLYGDMNTLGKRAEVIALGEYEFLITADPDRGDGECRIRLEHMPFDNGIEICASVSRYTLFIAFINRYALPDSRGVYEVQP